MKSKAPPGKARRRTWHLPRPVARRRRQRPSEARPIKSVSVSGTGFVAGTGGVRIRVGDGTPTATATDSFIANINTEYFNVTPGQKIAVIGNDAGTGNLSVTEMS